MRELLEQAAQRAISFLEGLDNRQVSPAPAAVAGLAGLNQPINDEPVAPADVIKQLDEVCSPATMAMAGPRFFGLVIGGSLPAALAAHWLAGAWGPNSGLFSTPPATAPIEQVALNWLLELFKLPPDCRGAFVTGACM